MPKIFRLYTGGSETYVGWNESPTFPYNSTNRNTISDPDGASARHEITSIPSPFARIDLVKTAFKEVNQMQDPDGDTIFHKMVSDSLDVAEIFFNINKYNGKIEVIKWDPKQKIDELTDSPLSGHNHLADALDKFLKSDGKTYNFDQMDSIYLLNYVNGPDEINIIGATSPATLFFSNANDLSYVNDIYFNLDRPFDEDYQPLYLRDPEFIMYLFSLRNSIPFFATLFPEVDSYLNLTFNKIEDPNFKQQLRNTGATNLANLKQIDIQQNQQHNYVEVLGNPLYAKPATAATNLDSEFTIKSAIYTGDRPLALPVEAGNKYSQLQYTTGKWGTTNAAPYTDSENDFTKRTLPFDGAKKAYLTLGDFLEDTIVKVEHALNKEHYFDGNINDGIGQLSYLLPIKQLLFKFFTVEDLQGNLPNGEKMFELDTLAGGSVKATLRIPIEGNDRVSCIEYSRIYYNDRKAQPNTNEGGMTTFAFSGFIMPLVKFNSEDDAIYNTACITNRDRSHYEFCFYNGVEKINPIAIENRNQNKKNVITSINYLIKKHNFDSIAVSVRASQYRGLIVPKFRTQINIDEFTFAIDLGTSNTHIEYRIGNGPAKPFAIEKKEVHACEFFKPSFDSRGNQNDLIFEEQLINSDFIPHEIGAGEIRDFKFPTRTALAYAETTDWNKEVHPYIQANLSHSYEKRQRAPYNRLKTDIKWAPGKQRLMTEAYLNSLMLMLRNKVLINCGDLKKTKIIWFYPISMPPRRKGMLQNAWDNAYNKYFGSGSTTCMTESAAPIQYFFNREATATDLVNIDIGGGTTDVAFSKNKKILYATSFRFASNTLFENPFSHEDKTNGIVDAFKDEIKKILDDSNIRDKNEITSIYDSILNNDENVTANMASFLFTLKENSLVKELRQSIDFNYKLQEDSNFKIVFVLFYTSIIYHIAQIIKAKGLDMPRHISFSGNGSKVLRIIATEPKLLAKYTKKIFELILAKPYGKELDILGFDKDANPKESTCKGGLSGCEDEDYENRIIVMKSDGSGFISSDDTYDSITPTLKASTVEAVRKFFDFVFVDLKKVFNFKDNFGVNDASIRLAQEMSKKDLDTFLEKGITQRLEENDGSARIEETFFFYPVKGVINSLSAEINQLKNNNQ